MIYLPRVFTLADFRAINDFLTVLPAGPQAAKTKTLASRACCPQVKLGDLFESHFNNVRTHPVWS
jgi:hypothetical protein